MFVNVRLLNRTGPKDEPGMKEGRKDASKDRRVGKSKPSQI